MTTPPRQPPTPAEDLVGGWLLAWLRGELDEDRLTKRLNRDVWHIDGATYDMWIALRGTLHAILVQLREVSIEHDEEDPPCGPSPRSRLTECTGAELCGSHRTALGAWMDILAMFVGQVVTQVPIRAAGSVERSMSERGRR